MDRPLAELKVLVMDFQATGADPTKGRLLELGWLPTSAAQGPAAPEAYVVRWPEEEELPRQVQKVTGITKEALTAPSAKPIEQIWARLLDASRRVAQANHQSSCPAIIHFSRFERAYLEHLSETLRPPEPPAFRLICTHEIVKRLLPDLPRRGLRAVAGYFGCSLPELRRAASHVTATAYVWKHLVEELAKVGIRTESQLRRWLESTPAPASTGRGYPMEREARLGLPEGPGVYRMRRSNGDVIYVGKARNLRHRVNSYFRKRRHPEHTLEMLTQASALDYTLYTTPFEAALAESDEIKRWAPAYNIALREGERRVRFVSRDGLTASDAVDEKHPLGPLPTERGVSFVGALAEALATGFERLSDDWPSRVGLAYPEAPENGDFRRGLELFAEKHQESWRGRPCLATLSRLGGQMWRERLVAEAEEEQERDVEEQDTHDNKDNDGPWQWTPERVSSWLEQQVLRAAHLLRRARWLCLLSESAVAWSASQVRCSGRRLLVFSRGAIAQRGLWPEEVPPPAPSGLARPLRERQAQFDLATYDRLSVATTELKRLIKEGRKVELRLSAGSVLSSARLARALQWL